MKISQAQKRNIKNIIKSLEKDEFAMCVGNAEGEELCDGMDMSTCRDICGVLFPEAATARFHCPCLLDLESEEVIRRFKGVI